ncbi:hypothetical protein M378DRAFT_170089 [Amanita muscaria Koide BX008]|uniref:Uncharacterized protein n=1 Tax=Amanita muscaria (strain Koide BX008) TaxID=946122 RepID=A0A0C2WRH4_AMAMK|nr:hypothetical protein M378DRAFT_170089 [Amanita muscaria Koide BX008]
MKCTRPKLLNESLSGKYKNKIYTEVHICFFCLGCLALGTCTCNKSKSLGQLILDEHTLAFLEALGICAA